MAKKSIPPRTKAKIIASFATGEPKAKIAKEVGHSVAIVNRILREASPGEIDRLRQIHLTFLWEHVIPEARRRIMEKLEAGQGSLAELNMILGTATDKAAVLSGMPSSILGVHMDADRTKRLDEAGMALAREIDRRRALSGAVAAPPGESKPG